MTNFENDLKAIENEIKRFALKYNAFKPENDKLRLHLSHAVGILDHVSRKHNPKPKTEKVNFT